MLHKPDVQFYFEHMTVGSVVLGVVAQFICILVDYEGTLVVLLLVKALHAACCHANAKRLVVSQD